MDGGQGDATVRQVPIGLGDAPTVRQALIWAGGRLTAAGVEDPGWDASLLLVWAMNVPRKDLFLRPDRVLTGEEQARFEQGAGRRAGREPLQYITGTQGFMGLDIAVDSRVLIPRRDTEVLVEAVLQFTRTLPGPGSRRLPVADLGTGSGAIAVALAVHDLRLQLTAVDLSPDALEVAGENARRHGVSERVELLQGDLLEPLQGRRFAAIACNPPYLDPAEAPALMPEVANHEPALALFSPDDPLTFYRRLADSAREYLWPGGMLAVEVGIGQGAKVAALLAESWGLQIVPRDDRPPHPGSDMPAHPASGMPAHVAPVPDPGTIQVRRDYGAVDRVVLARLDDTSSGS